MKSELPAYRNQIVRRVIKSIGVMALSVAIYVSYEAYQLHPDKERFFAADRIRTAAFNASMDTPEANDAFIAKAKRIREEWHTWAVAHIAALSAMRDPANKNSSAFDTVYAAIPSSPTSDNCGIPQDEVLMNSPLPFTWNAGVKCRTVRSEIKDPLLLAKMARGEESYFYQLHANYKAYRDIQLSQSVKTGAHQVVVWASGRVTQVVYMPKTDGRGTGLIPSFTDLCPQFSELNK